MVGGCAITPTSTATLVGLVTMSNTAERFCDCATSASMSSRDASASILKRTVTPSKPLRTSPSMPRMPARSIAPSSVACTERSWMLRFCATLAMPAVRQPGQADQHVLHRRGAVVFRREHRRMVRVETERGLVALLAAEPEKPVDVRSAVRAVHPVARRAPAELAPPRVPL